MNAHLRILCILGVGLRLVCAYSLPAQAKPDTKSVRQAKPLSTGHLVTVKTVTAGSEVATTFADPLTCDNDGNLYLQSNNYGVSGIRKFDPKGEHVTLFQPSGDPDLKVGGVGYFTVDQNQDLYELVFSSQKVTRYVIVYKPDGTYKSTIKLQPGFAFTPTSLGVFPSGNLLVSGLEYDKDRTRGSWPFTGIFSSDGRLLKEVSLEDDDTLHDLATSGDLRVASTTNPWSNHAIEFGEMAAAADGNVYLMRWITPTIFYAISPGGAIQRRFTVDPGDDSYRPADMHIAGNRLAILYFHPQTKQVRMVIVDLEGHEISAYDEVTENGKPKYTGIGPAFACYTENPQQFTFLGTGDDDKLQFTTVEGR